MKDLQYKSIIRNKIDVWERNVLGYLYLPIMGSESLTIFTLLLQDADFLKCHDGKFLMSLNHLEAITGIASDVIVNAIKRLEALSLIETVYNTKEDYYIYYLNAPVDPEVFFKTEILNNALALKVGPDQYEMIRFYFRDDSKVKATDEFENVTASFKEVFDDLIHYPSFDTEIAFKTKQKKAAHKLSSTQLEQIKQKLRQVDINNLDLSDEKTLALLNEGCFMFKLSLDQLVDIVKKAYNFLEDKLTRRDFIRAATDFMQETERASAFEPTTVNDSATIRMNNRLKKIGEFERYKSERFIAALLGTRSIDENLKKMLFKLRTNYKLHDSVINCLVEFSYYKNNADIVVNYVLKIGKTFADKDINTPEAAMEYLKNAFQGKSATTKTTNRSTGYTSGKNKIAYATIPEWTDEQWKERLESRINADELNIDEIIGKLE